MRTSLIAAYFLLAFTGIVPQSYAENSARTQDDRVTYYAVTLGMQGSYFAEEAVGMWMQLAGLFKTLAGGATGRLRLGAELDVTQHGGELGDLHSTTTAAGLAPKLENEWCLPILPSVCTLVHIGFGAAYFYRIWASETEWVATRELLVPMAGAGGGISFSARGTPLKFAIVGNRQLMSQGRVYSSADWLGGSGVGLSVRYLLY